MERGRPQSVDEDAQRGQKRSAKQAGKGRPAPSSPRESEAGEDAVLAKIAEMPVPCGSMGKRLHSIIMASAPLLSPRLWYGMPAYAKDGSVICFFLGGDKLKERYMTLGLNDAAKHDEGAMRPIAFALTELAAAEEEKVAALIERAVR